MAVLLANWVRQRDRAPGQSAPVGKVLHDVAEGVVAQTHTFAAGAVQIDVVEHHPGDVARARAEHEAFDPTRGSCRPRSPRAPVA